jgi:hypothetical protein
MTVAAAKPRLGPTIAVAREQHFPADRRIVDDDLAVRILPPGVRAFVWLARPAPVSAWLERFIDTLILRKNHGFEFRSVHHMG